MGNTETIGSIFSEGEKYPPYRKDKIFEEYACDYFNEYAEFIPAYWTRIINTCSAEKILISLKELANHPILDGSFCIATHDDAPLKLWGDRVKYFSAGGKVDGTIPIPLIAPNFPYAPLEKNIFAHFCGSLTHPCRQDILQFATDEGVIVKLKAWDVSISAEQEKENFDDMARAVFAFCPRGYGGTSFRLYEAIRLNCIPIYISDIHSLPFPHKVDWSKVAIICNNAKDGYETARSMTKNKISEMLEYTDSIKDNLLKFDMVCENIREIAYSDLPSSVSASSTNL
jgi:hypothetical protein